MEHYYHHIGENWFNYEDLYSRMVKEHRDGCVFVEVGSWKGRSASYMGVEIINSGKKILFTCVDTFRGSEEHIDPKSWCFCEPLSKDPDYLYNEFTKNTEPIIDILTTLRMESIKAAKLFENESIDFVFIDASHDYDNVVADINAWYPKVKKGGYIAGHDYERSEIAQAVKDTLVDHKIDTIVNCFIAKKP